MIKTNVLEGGPLTVISGVLSPLEVGLFHPLYPFIFGHLSGPQDLQALMALMAFW